MNQDEINKNHELRLEKLERALEEHTKVSQRLERIFNEKNVEIIENFINAISGARVIKGIIIWFTILIISIGGALTVIKGLWK